MRVNRLFPPVLFSVMMLAVLFLALSMVGGNPARVYGQGDSPVVSYTVFLPILFSNGSPTPQPGDAIIIDYSCTDIDQIPDYWIGQASQLTFHFAHTSHGSQILSGLDKLAELDSKYEIGVSHDPPSLSSEPGLKIYDGNNYDGNSYITPDMYWEESDGRDHTRSVANTGLFDYSMWSWCGQMSYYNDSQINLYNQTLSQLESDYAGKRFIAMTGHADADGSGSRLRENNQRVREYVTDNGMVLFDFWNIDSYDPDGNYHASNDDGQCLWCADWCAAHPGDCTDLPDSCAHSSDTAEMRYICKLKAQAFWWMMARLAGWPGPD